MVLEEEKQRWSMGAGGSWDGRLGDEKDVKPGAGRDTLALGKLATSDAVANHLIYFCFLICDVA